MVNIPDVANVGNENVNIAGLPGLRLPHRVASAWNGPVLLLPDRWPFPRLRGHQHSRMPIRQTIGAQARVCHADPAASPLLNGCRIKRTRAEIEGFRRCPALPTCFLAHRNVCNRTTGSEVKPRSMALMVPPGLAGDTAALCPLHFGALLADHIDGSDRRLDRRGLWSTVQSEYRRLLAYDGHRPRFLGPAYQHHQ